jgi:hypothetical protein
MNSYDNEFFFINVVLYTWMILNDVCKYIAQLSDNLLVVFLFGTVVGLTWMNLFKAPSGIKGDISVGLVWLMFIVDIIIYSIVTWYISSITPGKYILAKPWYFIFLVSYI